MTMAIGDRGGHSQLLDRIRIGMPVLDRTGQHVGRVCRVRQADPLVVSDDGRRIGQPTDLVALVGWSARQHPRLPRESAATLVRAGYVEIADRPPSRRSRYAALTDIASVDDDEVHLAVAAADLPRT
jgi:hypothetical protein